MKKITIIAALLVVAVTQAQQTFVIDDWQIGTNGNSASFTINIGDTVRWEWTDTIGHNLVPTPEETDAPDDFGVEEIIKENDFVYEYTFTEAAVIDYQCDPHDTNMFGTITIEEELSVQDKFEVNIKLFPNPVKEQMTISSLFSFDTYEIFDVNGKKLGEGKGEGVFTDLNTSYLSPGVYFVYIRAGELNTSVKMIKE